MSPVRAARGPLLPVIVVAAGPGGQLGDQLTGHRRLSSEFELRPIQVLPDRRFYMVDQCHSLGGGNCLQVVPELRAHGLLLGFEDNCIGLFDYLEKLALGGVLG